VVGGVLGWPENDNGGSSVKGQGWGSGVTWTCVRGARRRCRPTGGGRDPASAASGPGSVLLNEG